MMIRFYPLGPGEFPERTRPRKWSLFKAGWSQTLKDLERELEFLGATEVVISAGLSDRDIRIDGWPRHDARFTHPGVIVSFDSKYGPLRYLCDEYENGYQDNVRAIALGLEALRAVDRYGISGRGEQYTGWKQLTAGVGGPTTRQEAASYITGLTGVPSDEILSNRGVRNDAIRRAMFVAHPDHGGTDERFDLVSRARKLLETG